MVQYQILRTNITRTIWQTVRRIINEILEVKGFTWSDFTLFWLRSTSKNSKHQKWQNTDRHVSIFNYDWYECDYSHVNEIYLAKLPKLNVLIKFLSKLPKRRKCLLLCMNGKVIVNNKNYNFLDCDGFKKTPSFD